MNTTPIPAGADLPQGALTDALERIADIGYDRNIGEAIRIARAALAARPGVSKPAGAELPGMWDDSDFAGGWADTQAARPCATAAAGVPKAREPVTSEMLAAGLKAAKSHDPVLETLYGSELASIYLAMHAARSGATAAAGVPRPKLTDEQVQSQVEYSFASTNDNGHLSMHKYWFEKALRIGYDLAAQTETQPASEAVPMTRVMKLANAIKATQLPEESMALVAAFLRECATPAQPAPAQPASEAVEMGWHPRDLHIAALAQPAPAPGAGKEKQ